MLGDRCRNKVVPSLPYRTHTHTHTHTQTNTHTHTNTHHRFKIMLLNTDQTHDKISVNHYEEFQSSTALYSLMMDHIRSETCRSDF